MKLFAAIVLSIFAAGAIASSEQNHECQGHDNCNENGANGAPIEQIVTVSDDSVHETTQIVHTGDQNVALEIAPGAVVVSVATPESPVEVTTGGQTVSFAGSKYTEAARTAIAGYGNTTASCFRTYGLGGSSRSASWSIGWPVLDTDCILGEDAAQAFLMGNPIAGWRMYCHQPGVKRVYGAKRFRRGTHTAAVEGCLLEAGVAEMVAEANEFIDRYGDRFATLEETIVRQAAEIAAWEGRLVELETKPEPEPRPRITATTVRKIVAESAALSVVVGAVPETAPLYCPPIVWPVGTNALFCEGVAYLNPDRTVPPEAGLE